MPTKTYFQMNGTWGPGSHGIRLAVMRWLGFCSALLMFVSQPLTSCSFSDSSFALLACFFCTTW